MEIQGPSCFIQDFFIHGHLALVSSQTEGVFAGVFATYHSSPAFRRDLLSVFPNMFL